MPKIAAETAAQRRAHILDAARECFAEHGIHVSVDEICARAGISKGAFYGYFDSKDAAIQAIAEGHGQVVHKFSKIDSVESLVNELAELTTARSRASKRLELETWSHALKMPPLCHALEQNIEELTAALKSGIQRLATMTPANTPVVSEDSASEILSIFRARTHRPKCVGCQEWGAYRRSGAA